MTVIGTAWIDIKGDTDGFEKETESKIGNFAKKAAAIFAGAFAIDKGVDFLKDSIGAASDLNETINKSNTIFGANAKEIDKWSQTAATSLGLSRQKALDAAASFGDMFLQIGFSGKEATKMSKSVVQMAADIGSFNNLPTADVQERIAAAFRGEYDSLQAVIPNINAARVEQEAMATTGKKTTKELTAQEKAAAVLAIVHKDGARAMGDFSKTSDGLANSQKILSARMEDVKARIGTALLPIMTKLVALISNALNPAIDFLGDAWRSLVAGFKEGSTAYGSGVLGFFRALGDALHALIEAFHMTNVQGEDWYQTMGPMGKVAATVSQTIGHLWREVLVPLGEWLIDHKPVLIAIGVAFAAMIAPVATLAAGLIYLYVKFDVVRDVVDAVARGISSFVRGAGKELGDLVEYLQRNWEDFSEAFGHIMVVIRDIVTPILLAIRAIWNAVSDDIFNYVERVWNMIKGIISAVMEQIRGVIQVVTALINGDWGKAWDGVKMIFKGVWDEMYAIVSGILGLFSSTLGAFFSVFSTVWENGWDAIWNFLKDLPGRVLGALGDLTKLLVSKGADLIGGLIVGMADGAIAFAKWYVGLPLNVLGWIGDVAGTLFDKGADLIGGLVRGFTKGATDLATWFVNLPRYAGEWLGDVFPALIGKGADLIGGLLKGFGKGATDLATWFINLPRYAGEWIGNIFPALIGKGADLIGGFLSGFAKGATDLALWFMHLPGYTIGWIGNVLETLRGVGVDLIQGLINGIKSMGGALVDALFDALGPLEGLARRFFHANSPSKVFMAIGQDVVAGLAIGLGDTAPVDRAMAGLLGGVGNFPGLGGVSTRANVFAPGSISMSLSVGAGADMAVVEMVSRAAKAAVIDTMEQVIVKTDQRGPS